MSFMDKAAGVFYEPSRVFESLKSGVKTVDWLVPVLLLAILASISTYVRFTSPDLRFQMMEQQEQRFDHMVAQGKMTADQAQQAKDRMNSGSPAFAGIGMFGAFVVTFIIFFIAAGVWLLIGKFALKGTMTYSQTMGMAGIASWIMIVGVIVATALSVLLSRLDGGLNLGMLTQMNAESKVYTLMRNVDLFTLWNLAVTSIGLGVLASKKGAMPAIYVYGTWVVLVVISVFALGGAFGM